MRGWSGLRAKRALLVIGLVLLGASLRPAVCRASGPAALSRGQTVYLPVYSYVYYGDRGRKFDLTATISIRNTDPRFPITISSAKYYDWHGKLVNEYISKPVTLAPLGATHLRINESDLSGGLGASFLIQWQSAQKVDPPMVEAIMIGTGSTQGISFVCRGRAISTDHH